MKSIYEAAKNISLERGEEIMTIAEQLLKEGMEKGIEKGMEKNKREVAKELLKDGIEVALVVKYTKLSFEEVEDILKEIE